MEDFTFAHHDTPLGTLTSVCSPAGLVRVEFSRLLIDEASLADHADVDKQLLEYLSGERTRFDLPLDLPTGGFHAAAQRALLDIPYGRTVTYAELAAAAGNPRAVRAAGTACARNPLPIVVPCHRVVRTDGSVGNYAGGARAKTFLLDLEAKHG